MPIVKHYTTADNRNPFDEYLRNIKDPVAKAMVATRVARMATGNYGDCKVCRDGVSELRITRGPGYRVYFAYVTSPIDGSINLLLLCGTKKTQTADIDTATAYLNDYKTR